jgi:hypothetical protein
LHNDSRRGPVVRRVRRQAQDILLQIKAGTFRTHCVAMPVHGVSTCSFCLSFGREQRTPPASAECGNDRKRPRTPSLNPWSTSDFSRRRIEEPYEHSHPKMSGKLKARVVAADLMSAAAVQQFFNMKNWRRIYAAPPLEVSR